MFRPLSVIDFPSVSALRMARRGSRLYLLAKPNSDEQERVVAQMECTPLPIPFGSLQFFVHAGDEGQQAQVVFKNITLRAEEIRDLNPPQVTAPTKPLPTDSNSSLFERLINFFGTSTPDR